MLMILVPLITLIIGWMISNKSQNEILANIAAGIGILSGSVLLVALIFLQVNRSICKGRILEVEEVRRTYESDSLMGEYDRSGILVKVAEANGYIASSKYYAESVWFSWYWTDDVRNAQLINQ